MTIKKVIFIVGITTIFLAVSITIWWHLPVSINRYNDIAFANKIISKIDRFKEIKGLPNSNDWNTLKQFGFKDKIDFLTPEYEKIDSNTYELIFVEGFDGPYLMWNSKERIWKNSFPTIPSGKTIDSVFWLVEKNKNVKYQIQLIDSLSKGQRHVSILSILDDTLKNIYLVKVEEDNGGNLVTYYNYWVDANTMTIIDSTGKFD